MPAHPLLEKQNTLHAEATALLEEVLFPILKKYGEITVGGSYAYALLYKPDIDIDVVSEHCSKEIYRALCAELIAREEVSKFTCADRVHYPHLHPGERPFGYWLSPIIYFHGVAWSVDIWLQKPEWHTGNTSRYTDELRALSDEKRITILSLKEQLVTLGLYGVGKEFSSVDVYEGVLRGGVETVAELQNFISTHRKKTN